MPSIPDSTCSNMCQHLKLGHGGVLYLQILCKILDTRGQRGHLSVSQCAPVPSNCCPGPATCGKFRAGQLLVLGGPHCITLAAPFFPLRSSGEHWLIEGYKMPLTAPYAQSVRGHELGVCTDLAGQAVPARADTCWTQASLCRVASRPRLETVLARCMTVAPVWQAVAN